MSRAWIGAGISMAAALAAPRPARASPLVGTELPVEDAWTESLGRLRPGFASPGMRMGGGGPRAGLVLGGDLGPAFVEPSDGGGARLAAGVHLGAAFGNGLEVRVQFEIAGHDEQAFTGGVRYAFPGLPVEPFAELQAGLAWLEGAVPGQDQTAACAAPARGLVLPIGPFFAVVTTARDTLAFAGDGTTQALAAQVGLEFTVPLGRHAH